MTLRLTTTLLLALLAFTIQAQPWPVRDSANTYGYINPSGSIAIPFQYQKAYGFSNGLAPVQVKGQFHLIDTSGTIRHSFPDSISFGRLLYE